MNESGTEPENELERRVRVWRLIREEMEEGIGPKKLLSARSRIMRLVSWEVSGVSRPE